MSKEIQNCKDKLEKWESKKRSITYRLVWAVSVQWLAQPNRRRLLPLSLRVVMAALECLSTGRCSTRAATGNRGEDKKATRNHRRTLAPPHVCTAMAAATPGGGGGIGGGGGVGWGGARVWGRLGPRALKAGRAKS